MKKIILIQLLLLLTSGNNVFGIEFPTRGDISSEINVEISLNANDKIQMNYIINPADYLKWFENEDIPTITHWIAIPENTEISLSSGSVEVVSAASFGDLPSSLQGVRINESLVTRGNGVQCGEFQLIPISFIPVINEGSENASLIKSFSYEIALDYSLESFPVVPFNLRSSFGNLLINNHFPRRDEGGEGSGYVYVLPDDERVSEVMEDLIQWRKLQGYNVRTITIQENFSWEVVFQRIQDVNIWQEPVEYVCLVGDFGGDFSIPSALRGTSDYHYSLLSGNDFIPDAAVGRISYNTINQLSRIVEKILDYETNPDVEDIEGYRRGAVAAGNPRSGLSSILVSRWVRDQLLDYGFSEVDTLFFTSGGSVEDFMRRAFDSGSAFVNYRGWTGLEDWSANEAGRLTNRKLPVALLLGCSTGDYFGIGGGYTENLLRAEGGAIGAIGNATLQSRVNYNNAMMAGFYKSVLDEGECRLGWILNRAKMELLSIYGQFRPEWVRSHMYWTNLMGDPATVIWRGVPHEVDLDVEDNIIISSDGFEVNVSFDDTPVQGARVGLYKVDEIVTASYTDENGVARFEYDPAVLEPGAAFITVSGDQIIPVTEEIRFAEADRLVVLENIQIIEDGFEPHVGNGNGIIEPFETFEITFMVSNIGWLAVNNPIDFALTIDNNSLEIDEENIRLDEMLMPDGIANVSFLVTSLGNFPDREDIALNLGITSGEEEWIVETSIRGIAPRWSIVSLFPDDDLQPGMNRVFDIILENNGSLNVAASFGIIESLSIWAEVNEEVGEYEEMFVGDIVGAIDGEIYEIIVDEFAPPGEILGFRLTMRAIDENENFAELFFSLQVEEIEDQNTLTGPDSYGYWAIDNFDQLSNIVPRFAWRELNPRLNGNGINTNLLDRGEDEDQSLVLDLPFTFQYYGEDYNEITVCTNGWAAFGSQSSYLDFRNLPIGSPQGPGAQLCPFWDDLYMTNATSGVFYRYDVNTHTFIIEWSMMNRWIGLAGPGAQESFQVVLYDPQWYPTYTGDGDIVFLYRHVTHEARIDANSTPYATIGIGNPEDDGGLQYGFWNQWEEGARAPGWNSAIKFATAGEHRYAVVSGTVRALVDGNPGEPIAGAVVRSSTGGWTVTNDAGVFENFNVLAELNLQLIVSADGFNTQISEDMEIEFGGQRQFEFVLPHPEIAVDVEAIEERIEAGEGAESGFQISNNGNGNLTYAIDFAPSLDRDGMNLNYKLPNNNSVDDIDDAWDDLYSLNVSEIVDDSRILGVVYTEDGFWISGGANGQMQNFLYHFTRDGELVERLDQPTEDRWGMHDLAWDGEFIYGGCRNTIYKLNQNGEEVERLESPLAPPTALAVDPDSREIFLANDGDPIHRLDPEGNVLQVFPHRLRPLGMGWYSHDKDGYQLYIFSADGENNLALSKLNVETGDFKSVTQFELEENDRAGGCEFSVEWDTRRWSLLTIVQNPVADMLYVFDVEPNYSWLAAEPTSGEVEPDRQQDITLTLNADLLDQGLYNVDLQINHNAADGLTRIPVTLTVDPQAAGVQDPIINSFVLSSIFPNPSNGATIIQFSLKKNGFAKLVIIDNLGRIISETKYDLLSAGQHNIAYDMNKASSGVYFVRLETTDGVQTKKFVLIE